MILACDDANSKLVEQQDHEAKLVDVVNVADDDLVGNNLLQIWTLTFGPKATLLFRL